jgi:hypothetical protein
MSETYLSKSGAVRSVDNIFVIEVGPGGDLVNTWL